MMMYEHTDYPKLTSEHLRNATLYANREDMVADLYGESGGTVGEVGVAVGNFSKYLIEKLRPKKFVAIDIFDLHQHPVVWGIPTTEMLNNKTHKDFYADEMRGLGAELSILEGDSGDQLAGLDDGLFDLLYIDAGHSYAAVKRDATIAVEKVKRNGLLVFNDYIMIDHLYSTPYGVVQAVNELVVASSFRIVGFALHHQLFCDIALRRF